ncbi:MAG: DUF4082 domain-containing protein [Candidatus Omnitrophota bacterium]
MEFTPWQSGSPGPGSDFFYDMTAGYRFIPKEDIQVTKVWGYFDGAHTVSLWNAQTGEKLAAGDVTSYRQWQSAEITPVTVHAGVPYIVAAYIGQGSGVVAGSAPNFPLDYNEITIESTAYGYGDKMPDAFFKSAMLGMVDISIEPKVVRDVRYSLDDASMCEVTLHLNMDPGEVSAFVIEEFYPETWALISAPSGCVADYEENKLECVISEYAFIDTTQRSLRYTLKRPDEVSGGTFEGSWTSIQPPLQGSIMQENIPAALVAPAEGTIISENEAVFSWHSGSNVASIYMIAGLVKDDRIDSYIYQGYQMSESSRTVTIPLYGQPVRVLLISKFYDGFSRFQEQTFETGYPVSRPAEITLPAEGAILESPTITFEWDSGVGAQGYYLSVGTSIASQDLGGGEQDDTSATLSNIPMNGEMVYVRLWSRLRSGWEYRDYVYETKHLPFCHVTDCDADGDVDSDDASTVIAYFGDDTCGEENSWCEYADADRDGDVDLDDVSSLISSFGTSTGPCIRP